MPKPLLKTACLVLALTLLAGGGPTHAADAPDIYLQIVDAKAAYSAKITLSNGEVSITGSIHHRPGATRTHLGRTVVIHEFQRERWLQFLPGTKQYITLSSRGQAKAPYLPPRVGRADLRVATVGMETVAGEKTRKLKLTFRNGVMMLWQTPDGIVIKAAGWAMIAKRKHTVTMVMSELKRGSQDPALFVPPPGAEPLGGPPKKKPGPRKDSVPKAGGKKKAAGTR